MSYPRHWHWVYAKLERFDMWFSRRIEGRRLRWLWITLVFPLFVAVRFLALVAVLEITIIAFTVSIYLVWGEWILLILVFPFGMLARLAHLRPWLVTARAGDRRWTARVIGWQASGHSADDASQALSGGGALAGTPWTATARRARVWM